MGVMGVIRWASVMMGGGVVMLWWCWKVIRGGGTKVGCLGVMEKREKWRGTCTKLVRVGGKMRNSDLKIGHVRVQLKCDRSYVGAFDRIRAEGVSKNGLFVRT
jgi:hypothetical protein